MSFQSAPYPANTRIVDKDGKPTKPLIDYETARNLDLDAAPARLPHVERTGQGAAIGTTSLPLGSLAQGLYRVTVYARVVRPATTSSSFQVSLSFTDKGDTVTITDAAVTGNTVQAMTSFSRLIRVDQPGPISYAVAYASVGATSMLYDLCIEVEQVRA